jgi:hypothetical protein
MPEAEYDEFLEIRKPGAHLDEAVVADDFVLSLGVDLTNYPKFARVDDDVTYAKGDLDTRQQLDVDSGAELSDYSGPYRADLRFTDFSRDALASGSCRGARSTCSCASTAGPTRSRGGTARRRWRRSSGPPGTTRSSPSSSA